MPRRPNGTGTVFARSDGRYCIRLKDAMGVQQTRYARTEVAAKEILTQLQEERAAQLRMGTPYQTYAAFSAQWLHQTKRHNVRAQSYRSYTSRRELAMPYLGRYRLCDLRPAHIRAFLSRLQDRDLSPATVHAAFILVRECLDQAVKDDLIAKNPTRAMKSPRQETPERTILTEAQMTRLLTETVSDRHHPLWVLLCTTGIRVGEALALDWRDVDLTERTMAIHATVTCDRFGHADLGPTKTRASNRTLDLAPLAVDALRAHRAGQTVRRLTHDPVFPGRGGGHLGSNVVLAALQATLTRLDLPVICTHDLRHSFATALLGRRVNVRVVQETLGHSDIRQTLQTYGHVSRDARREVATVMQEALRG